MTRSASSKAQAIPDPPQSQRSGGRIGAAAAALASAERRMTRAAARAAAEAGGMGSPDEAHAAAMDAAAAIAAAEAEAAAAAGRPAPMDEDGATPPGSSEDGGESEHEDVMLQVWHDSCTQVNQHTPNESAGLSMNGTPVRCGAQCCLSGSRCKSVQCIFAANLCSTKHLAMCEACADSQEGLQSCAKPQLITVG